MNSIQCDTAVCSVSEMILLVLLQHGQKKVQRTEEEKQSTKKRFQKYQAAMTKILKKRNALMQPDKTQSASGAATEDSEGQKQRVMQRPSNKQYIRQELAEACRQVCRKRLRLRLPFI